MLKIVLALVALCSVSVVMADVLDTGTNFASDINNIDFANVLGGPMSAVVTAQIAATKATMNFVNKVGFITAADGTKTVLLMQFQYVQQANNGTSYIRGMEIPFLYIVPIPYLTFSALYVDFNMKLNAIADQSTTDTLGIQGAVHGSLDIPVVNVALSGSVGYQKTETTGVHIERQYSMRVTMTGSQTQQPPGMSKMLELFDTIVAMDLPVAEAS